MDIDKVLRLRYSCRDFELRKGKPARISFNDLSEICEAAMFGPMAGNIFTVKLILVTEKESIEKLADFSSQDWIKDAYAIIVVTSDKKRVKLEYGSDAKVYVRQQAGAAIENMLLKATSLGVGSCWVGAFGEKQVKQLLRIPDEIQVEALIVLGRPTRQYAKKHTLKQKSKPELSKILSFNKWKGKRYKENVVEG